MDALILSCGTGGGHNSACAAIEQELKARGHNVKTLNPYSLKSEHVSSAVDNAYITLAQKAPSAFGMVYRLGNAYRKLPFFSPVYYLNRGMAPLLEQYIRENNCDAVITTHLFPAEILTNMKRLGREVPKSYFIATDYTCIPFTEETDCDYYIIPSEDLTEEFVSRGIPGERILPLGIPVRQQFGQSTDKKEAREKLGLDPEGRYILVAGGSIGAGQIELVLSLLLSHYGDSVRVIVVCGNNRTLYGDLEKSYGGKCILLQYTSRMADYMKACDLFLSKPGGLSSTEAVVAGVPLIHITPIPGCETCNMQFFERHGMCIAVNSPKKQLLDACDRLLEKTKEQQMSRNQHRFIHGDAACKICDFIEAEYKKTGQNTLCEFRPFADQSQTIVI